jgi:hypothetical protein
MAAGCRMLERKHDGDGYSVLMAGIGEEAPIF